VGGRHPGNVFGPAGDGFVLETMIVGLFVVVAVLGRGSPAEVKQPPPPIAKERPWMTREATAQLVSPRGTPGPLFAGIDLGGPPPSPEARDRVAKFARANDVDIRFEIKDDELAAIRLSVTYHGCCGYEGADALGRTLNRHGHGGPSCIAPSEFVWDDDWAYTLDGIQAHVRVRVNRVDVRWEAALDIDETLDRVEALLGQSRASVEKAAGDRWSECPDSEDCYKLEIPWHIPEEIPGFPDFWDLAVFTEHGLIASVSFQVVLDSEYVEEALLKRLDRRWGRRRKSESSWVWHRGGSTFELDVRERVLLLSKPIANPFELPRKSHVHVDRS
jgi:hypothetical protein